MVLISTMERFLFLTAFAILPTICASATVYYVDGSNGNDFNRGDSIQNAFASIKACVDALDGPGDECHIRAGRYHQPVFQISGKQGSQSQPIVIRGYQDEVPVIDGTIPLAPKAGWKLDPKTGIFRCSSFEMFNC